VAESEPTAPKRRVRNPETFRERAVKATAENDKPPRRRPIRSSFSTFFRPIGRTLTRIFSVQPFKSVKWLAKLIGKIVFPTYFRNSARELKLVQWPNWKQSRQLTFAVLAFAVVFGAAIAGVDYGLDKVFKAILLK
jgi:preprotein translocase SecE subunit